MAGPATYTRGAAILCLGIAAYIVQDLIMKIASGHYPIHQALALRALTALPIAVLLIYLSGSLKAIKGSTRPMLPRSMLTVICNLTYSLALAALPMATVGALYLSAPLMITALSVLLLQEKVNAAQWGAVAAGFVVAVVVVVVVQLVARTTTAAEVVAIEVTKAVGVEAAAVAFVAAGAGRVTVPGSNVQGRNVLDRPPC